MKPEEILALMNEPACAHNDKAKSGCAKPQPGATQGGCCFDGARNALLPIADVAHLVHGPIGCAGSSWDNRGTRSSGADTYRIGMTTDLSRDGRDHGARRKAPVPAPSARPSRPIIRRRCSSTTPACPPCNGDDIDGGRQGRSAALRRAGDAGRLRRLLRQQEPRQPHRRRRRSTSMSSAPASPTPPPAGRTPGIRAMTSI